MKRLLIAAAVIVVLAVIIVVNVHRSRGKVVEVEISRVARKDLVEKVSGSGRIEARKSVSITSRVVGKVIEANADEGDAVEKGDVILRIDPGERDAALEQARAALSRAEASEQLAEAELRKAAFELRRANGLVTNGLSSDREMEAAQTSHDVAQARVREARENVRSARAGVEQAEYELDKTVIRAEIPGVIVRLSVEEGENVLAGDLYNAGSPMLVIADLSQIETQILVDETEVVKVRVGQPAEVEIDAFPDRKIPGKVVEVGNSAYNAGTLDSQEAKDFRVKILLDDPPPDLRPGLSARAEIVTQTRDDAIAVPIAALTIRDPTEEAEKAEGKRRTSRRRARDGEDVPEVEGVFRVQDGRAVFTACKTGIAGEKDFEVTEGLAEGDEIVSGPFEAIRSLESGQKVKAKHARSRGSAAQEKEDAEPAAGEEGEEEAGAKEGS